MSKQINHEQTNQNRWLAQRHMFSFALGQRHLDLKNALKTLWARTEPIVRHGQSQSDGLGGPAKAPLLHSVATNTCFEADAAEETKAGRCISPCTGQFGVNVSWRIAPLLSVLGSTMLYPLSLSEYENIVTYLCKYQT